MVSADADGLGDPLPAALGDGLDSPSAGDAAAEGDEAAGLLVLLETHPTMVTTITRVSGGAAIRNGVRRQKGLAP